MDTIYLTLPAEYKGKHLVITSINERELGGSIIIPPDYRLAFGVFPPGAVHPDMLKLEVSYLEFDA